MFTLSHRFVLFATLIAYVFTGQTLSAEKVFFSSTVFLKLIINLILLMPTAVATLGEMLVSIKRIEVSGSFIKSVMDSSKGFFKK